MTDARGYYAVLGLTSTATPAEIKSAFYAKAKALHPDAGELGDQAAFQAICEAYQILGNRERRAAYDLADGQVHPVGETLVWVARSGERDAPPSRAFSWQIALGALLLMALAAVMALADLTRTGRDGTSRAARYDSAEPTGPPAVSRFDAETDAAAAETLAVPAAPEQSVPHRPAR